MVGGMFFVWALGPHLMAFGQNTAMILPEAFVRFVPILANARMPSRTLVVVDLALALLSAIAVAAWRRRARQPTFVLASVLLLVVADYLPAPFPLLALDRPAIYDTLRERPEPGALCELPIGVGDGIGTVRAPDTNRLYEALYHQTIHGRSLVGGFVSRLPPGVVSAYEHDQLIGALWRLSGHQPAWNDDPPLPDRWQAAASFEHDGIRFVMLDRSRASHTLVDYVERRLPLKLVAQDAVRSLYLVEP